MKKFLPSYTLSVALSCSFLLAGMLLLVSCSPSKKLMKEAHMMEQGGLNNEALTRYKQVYTEYSRADALVGMKRVAQSVLDTKLQQAQMMCMAGNFEGALEAYDDAIAFNASHAQLELRAIRSPEELKRDCRNQYIDQLCRDAEELLNDGDYDGAHVLIQKVFRLDRNNKRAEYLDAMCEILPNYQAGLIAEENGLWREAYTYFNEVCRVDPGFSDALKKRDEALKKSVFSVVYKISDNRFVANNHENALAARIKGELLNSKNPFIEVLEREDLDIIIREQQETMNPQFEDGPGSAAGKFRKARFILSGELLNLTYDDDPEKVSKCDCGAVYRIYSDKVDCYAYTSAASLSATFKFKLMDAESGKLYQSQVLQFSKDDIGKRYSYDIRQKLSLTSPTGFRDHDVNLSGMINPETDPLLSEDELMHLMQDHFAQQVGKIMEGFRP